jgi:hypothetical protein
VRIGGEVFGYRNIGVDFPPGRWSAAEGRLLRAALEAAGVPSAENALAPKVAGDLLGNVRVRDVGINWGDAAGLLGMPRRGCPARCHWRSPGPASDGWRGSSGCTRSTTCEPICLPVSPITANVVLAACTSNPMYLLIAILLRGLSSQP